MKEKVLKPKACEKCGKEGVLHGHHYDYAKPYEVVFLCPKCHVEVHKTEKIKNRDIYEKEGDKYYNKLRWSYATEEMMQKVKEKKVVSVDRSKTKTIYISDEMHHKVKLLATELGITIQELVESILDKWFEQNKGE